MGLQVERSITGDQKAKPRVSLLWNAPPYHSTTKGKCMRSKFNTGDKVIIKGGHYRAHENHEATVVSTQVKNRSEEPTGYLGTRRIYSVECSCGSRISPKADMMELLT